MNMTEFRFEFASDVDLSEAESTLRLALLATEGVYGEARVRTEATYTIEPLRAEFRVSGHAPVVETVVQVFTSLATREFGREAFTIRPTCTPEPTTASAA